MLLAIDVGNTNIVFGLFQNTKPVAEFRACTVHGRTKDEYSVLFNALLEDGDIALSCIDHVVLASVVPPITEILRTWARDRLGKEPLVVEPGIKTGMAVLYDYPREVGADRIVNGIAAFEYFRNEPGGPYGVVVVDFGTATTFDVVSNRGEYLGGAIAPGIGISTEALFQHAAKLPRIDLVLPASAIGKSTMTSMQAGILFGYAALVDGLVLRMQKELSFETRVIGTGGYAPLIAKCSSVLTIVDECLTLQGLQIVHSRNA